MPEEKPFFSLSDFTKNYIKSPRRWAVGVILIALISLVMCYDLYDLEKQSKANSPAKSIIKNPSFLYVTMALSIIIIILSIACLASRAFRPGYYFIFSIYLLYSGIFFILSFSGPWSVARADFSWIWGIVLIVWGIALIALGINRTKKQRA